jgi:chemotaxis protein histidine kinase CheA
LGDVSGGGGGALASKADTVARLVASLSHATGRMPGISREQVLLHDTWYAAYRQYSSRVAARRAQWQREWGAYLEGARTAFAKAQGAAADAGERESARREQEQRQRQMHARLLGQRQAAEVEAAVAAEVQRALSEAQAAVAAAHSAAAAAEAQAKKRALDSYRREREAIEARLEANRLAVEELAAQERKAAAAAGAERLAVRRQTEEEQRRSKSEALAAEAGRLEADRSAALQRLIASVPYYSRVQEIAATSDAGRLVQPTAAFAAASEMSRAYAEFLAEVAMATKADAAALAEAPAREVGARAGGGIDGEPGGAGESGGLGGEEGEGEGDAEAEGAGGEGEDGLGELLEGGRARAAGGRGGTRSVATRRTHGSVASAWSARGSMDLSAAARYAAAAAAGGVPSHLTGAAAAEHAELVARKAAALSRLAYQRTAEQGIYARTGFEDKRITRDPRWRAMTALQEAGLQRSQHARQAFAGMQAAGRGATTALVSGSSAGVAAAFAGDGSGH